MPHLAFQLSATPPADAQARLADAVIGHFAAIMDTGTDHIAVSVRCGLVLAFRRAGPGPVAFLDADLRRGRTSDQKRRFALAVFEELQRHCGVPARNAYVIFTEHDGPDFHLDDGALPSWSEGEDPLAALKEPPRR